MDLIVSSGEPCAVPADPAGAFTDRLSLRRDRPAQAAVVARWWEIVSTVLRMQRRVPTARSVCSAAEAPPSAPRRLSSEAVVSRGPAAGDQELADSRRNARVAASPPISTV